MLPLALASFKAIKVNTVICVVKALVEATPISGPACVYAPAFVSLAIVDPTTLHTPKTKAPLDFANLIAASVSAVSPDCDIAITTSFSVITGLRYLNSDAYSTSTGILAKSSKIYSATKPACHYVPQATIIIRLAFKNFSILSSIPAMRIIPSLANKRPL